MTDNGWRPSPGALSCRGVAIPDDLLGPRTLTCRPAQYRVIAEAVELGLGDEVAWALIVGEAATLHAYRVVFGNRPRRRRRAG